MKIAISAALITCHSLTALKKWIDPYTKVVIVLGKYMLAG